MITLYGLRRVHSQVNSLSFMTRYCSFLVLLLLTGASIADSREALVVKYVAALSDQRFQEAAQLIRGSDLADYKNSFSVLFRAEAQAGKADLLRAAFGDKATLDDALNAPPEAVFAATMRVVMRAATQLNIRQRQIRCLRGLFLQCGRQD